MVSHISNGERLHSEPQHLPVRRHRLLALEFSTASKVFWQFRRTCRRIADGEGMASYIRYQQADTQDSSKRHSFTKCVTKWHRLMSACQILTQPLSKNRPRGGKWTDPVTCSFQNSCWTIAVWRYSAWPVIIPLPLHPSLSDWQPNIL